MLVKGYIHPSYVVSRLPYGSRASRGRKRDVYCTGLFTTAPQQPMLYWWLSGVRYSLRRVVAKTTGSGGYGFPKPRNPSCPEKMRHAFPASPAKGDRGNAVRFSVA